MATSSILNILRGISDTAQKTSQIRRDLGAAASVTAAPAPAAPASRPTAAAAPAPAAGAVAAPVTAVARLSVAEQATRIGTAALNKEWQTSTTTLAQLEKYLADVTRRQRELNESERNGMLITQQHTRERQRLGEAEMEMTGQVAQERARNEALAAESERRASGGAMRSGGAEEAAVAGGEGVGGLAAAGIGALARRFGPWIIAEEVARRGMALAGGDFATRTGAMGAAEPYARAMNIGHQTYLQAAGENAEKWKGAFAGEDVSAATVAIMRDLGVGPNIQGAIGRQGYRAGRTQTDQVEAYRRLILSMGKGARGGLNIPGQLATLMAGANGAPGDYRQYRTLEDAVVQLSQETAAPLTGASGVGLGAALLGVTNQPGMFPGLAMQEGGAPTEAGLQAGMAAVRGIEGIASSTQGGFLQTLQLRAMMRMRENLTEAQQRTLAHFKVGPGIAGLRYALAMRHRLEQPGVDENGKPLAAIPVTQFLSRELKGSAPTADTLETMLQMQGIDPITAHAIAMGDTDAITGAMTKGVLPAGGDEEAQAGERPATGEMFTGGRRTAIQSIQRAATEGGGVWRAGGQWPGQVATAGGAFLTDAVKGTLFDDMTNGLGPMFENAARAKAAEGNGDQPAEDNVGDRIVAAHEKKLDGLIDRIGSYVQDWLAQQKAEGDRIDREPQ